MATVVDVGHPSDLQKLERIKGWFGAEGISFDQKEELLELAEKCEQVGKPACRDLVLRFL
jgi:hypothetical protein